MSPLFPDVPEDMEGYLDGTPVNDLAPPKIGSLADKRRENRDLALATAGNEMDNGLHAIALYLRESNEDYNRLLTLILKGKTDYDAASSEQNIAPVKTPNAEYLLSEEYKAQDRKLRKNAILITDEQKKTLHLEPFGNLGKMQNHAYYGYLKDPQGALINLYFTLEGDTVLSYYAS